MFIKNLQNGMIQEIHNADVIKAFENDDRYLLFDEVRVEETCEEKTADLEEMTVAQLRAKAKKLGIAGASSLNKSELLNLLKGE